MNEREKMLKEVMVYEFALIDAGLYLDSYPDSSDAADYFCKTRVLLRNAVSKYEEKFGPLTYDGDNMFGQCGWRWNETPWPWEMGE